MRVPFCATVKGGGWRWEELLEIEMKCQSSKERVGKGPASESRVLHSSHSWCAEASQAPRAIFASVRG